MKKFLTVLLVIAVMFTFSFGSAFAAPTAGTVVATKAEAVKAITDKVDGYVADVNTDLAKVISEYASYAYAANVSKEAYTAVVTELAEEAIATLQVAKVNALNALETAEKNASANDQVILGYAVKEATSEAGYVDVYTILGTIVDPDFAATNFAGNYAYDVKFLEEEFDLVKTNTLAAINAVDLSVYSTTADTDNDGIKDYAEAVEYKRQALVTVGGIKLATGDNTSAMLTKIGQVKGVFYVANKGTTDEALAGTLGQNLNALKKTTVEATDAKMGEYAKANLLAEVKAVLEAGRAAEVKAQNEIILAQELSAKPNQKAIKAAKEAIETINAQYDAMMEVWTYRIETATFKVKPIAGETYKYIQAYYDNAEYNKLGGNATYGVSYFKADNTWAPFGIYANGATIDELKGVLSAADALTIAKAVDALEAEAAALKATIFVDGDVAADVDADLADAVEATYMTGTKASLNPVTVKDAAHARIHTLIESAAKVTVDGTKYPAVNAWDDDAATIYDAAKAKEVAAVVKAAKAALKACETVAEADAAFVAAYAEFDAIMTDAEHDAMFVYGGSLYEAYTKAVAEINAYVGYKADLMDDTYPGASETTLKNYYTDATTGVLQTKVYSASDLEAKVAEAKATIDGLKTKKELKAEDEALAKKVLAVAVPVTAAAKDEVVALYKEIAAFDAYCDMVGYSNSTTEESGLIATYVATLADIEEEAIADAKAAIDKDGKIKLDEKAAVEALAAAVKAYNDLYAYDLETETALSATTYTDEIFALEVDEVEAQIAALPVGAAAADVAAARAAVEALGFDGICQMNEKMLEKLAKFEDDAEVEAIYAVQALKITAKSTAKKGSITVKWSVEGDADAVDYYVVAKSTKANKGFKKAIETTKMSYKNTKNLKKGTRYYYKVQAVAVVDGVEYTSDWSNKAFRKAK